MSFKTEAPEIGSDIRDNAPSFETEDTDPVLNLPENDQQLTSKTPQGAHIFVFRADSTILKEAAEKRPHPYARSAQIRAIRCQRRQNYRPAIGTKWI